MKKTHLIPGGAALALLMVSATRGNSRDTYARFVSPPLKDGTRYTFLYPSRMASARYRAVGGNVLLESPVKAPQPFGKGSALSGTAHAAVGYDFIEVNQEVLAPGYRADPRRDNRLNSKSRLAHTILLFDTRSRRVFQLNHEAHPRFGQRFKQDDKIVSNSFRILPPGAPVPSP